MRTLGILGISSLSYGLVPLQDKGQLKRRLIAGHSLNLLRLQKYQVDLSDSPCYIWLMLTFKSTEWDKLIHHTAKESFFNSRASELGHYGLQYQLLHHTAAPESKHIHHLKERTYSLFLSLHVLPVFPVVRVGRYGSMPSNETKTWQKDRMWRQLGAITLRKRHNCCLQSLYWEGLSPLMRRLIGGPFFNLLILEK